MLYIFQGLSGSGKSTEAHRIVRESGGKVKRINKDDLRAMLDGGVWTKKNEGGIIRTRNALIRMWLESGYDVICDDTNLNPIHIKQLKTIADEFSTDTKVILFDVPLEECVQRDSLRDRPVGRAVIQKQYDDYHKEWNLTQ